MLYWCQILVLEVSELSGISREQKDILSSHIIIPAFVFVYLVFMWLIETVNIVPYSCFVLHFQMFIIGAMREGTLSIPTAVSICSFKGGCDGGVMGVKLAGWWERIRAVTRCKRIKSRFKPTFALRSINLLQSILRASGSRTLVRTHQPSYKNNATAAIEPAFCSYAVSIGMEI